MLDPGCVPAQSCFASLIAASEHGLADLPTCPGEEAEGGETASTKRIEFDGKRQCCGAIVRMAGEGEAQEAQLPLLQFALRLLKLFDRHKHRHAHFILELRNNRYECC